MRSLRIPCVSQTPDQHALAPVTLDAAGDSVSHSLAILAKVYHYNHWVFDCIRPHIGQKVVEVGAGIGNITQFLLNVEKLVCLEPFEPYFQYLKRRMAAHLNVTLCPHRIEDVPNADLPEGGFDTTVCLNVLEHIADDAAALGRMRQLVSPGGKVIIFVPALPVLYGEMDRAMGHIRRYTRPALARLFRQAGLRPTHSRYVNVVGALGWLWNGRVLRRGRIPESATVAFDRMVPILSALERLIPPLAGQSLLMVGRPD